MNISEEHDATNVLHASWGCTFLQNCACRYIPAHLLWRGTVAAQVLVFHEQMPSLSNSPKKRPNMWGSHYMTSEDIELRSFASSFRRFETSYCLLRHGIQEAFLLDYDPEDEGTTIVRNVGNHLSVNLLTSWSRVLPNKLISPQLVRKFPTFYETRRFITEFTTASHLSLPCARSMESMPTHPTSWNSILI